MNNTLENLIDGSLESLNIGNSLDLVKYDERFQTLVNICKKLRYSGVIELSGTELGDLSRHIHQGYVSTKDANSLLFDIGGQSVAPMTEVTEQLQSMNFKIVNARRNKYQYYIKAVRAEPSDN